MVCPKFLVPIVTVALPSIALAAPPNLPVNTADRGRGVMEALKRKDAESKAGAEARKKELEVERTRFEPMSNALVKEPLLRPSCTASRTYRVPKPLVMPGNGRIHTRGERPR